MIEVVGNLWDFDADYRIITTNGFVKQDGCNVMGRGCAKEAAQKFPKLPFELGQSILRYGNIVHTFPQYGLFTFPVKHHWSEPADLQLIAQSVRMLKIVLLPSVRYVMPRAGCGAGLLQWEYVKPILAELPDNVKVIDFG